MREDAWGSSMLGENQQQDNMRSTCSLRDCKVARIYLRADAYAPTPWGGAPGGWPPPDPRAWGIRPWGIVITFCLIFQIVEKNTILEKKHKI